jgi:hypothetical protein
LLGLEWNRETWKYIRKSKWLTYQMQH